MSTTEQREALGEEIRERFEEIMNTRGVNPVYKGVVCMFSEGVRTAAEKDPDFRMKFLEIIDRYSGGDFGCFYEDCEEHLRERDVALNRAKGLYITDWGNIYVDGNGLGMPAVCFHYER